MAQYKTRGIIIRRRNFGEADKVLTIYTEKRGKVSAIAKGVRKPLSKLAGHLELFYLTDFHLVEGKNLHTVTGAVLIDDLSGLRKNSEKINQTYYIAELIDQLIREHEPAKEIFNLLAETFKYLDKNNNPLLLPYFELQLLSRLGHRPELDYCLKCRKKLINKENFWDNSGGIICNQCIEKYHGSFKKINNDTIKILRLLLKNNLKIIGKLSLDLSLEITTRDILDEFIEYVSEREIKSKKFLRR